MIPVYYYTFGNTVLPLIELLLQQHNIIVVLFEHFRQVIGFALMFLFMCILLYIALTSVGDIYSDISTFVLYMSPSSSLYMSFVFLARITTCAVPKCLIVLRP